MSNNFSKYSIDEALKVVDEAIYQIEDNITSEFGKELGTDKARDILYNVFYKAYDIIQNDDKLTEADKAELIEKYNLFGQEKEEPSFDDDDER